jgi:hypothetical protein
MIYHFITGFVTSLTRRVHTSGAETAYSSGAPEFIPGFIEFRAAPSLVFMVHSEDFRFIT